MQCLFLEAMLDRRDLCLRIFYRHGQRNRVHITEPYLTTDSQLTTAGNLRFIITQEGAVATPLIHNRQLVVFKKVQSRMRL